MFVSDVLAIAQKYYPVDKLEHAMRVANYIKINEMIMEKDKETCFKLAIMHDLIEDTEFTLEQVEDTHMKECLRIITKEENLDYLTYIKRIKVSVAKYPEVYWVKIADMKDHLSLKETLTERLRDKYLNALAELL